VAAYRPLAGRSRKYCWIVAGSSLVGEPVTERHLDFPIARGGPNTRGNAAAGENRRDRTGLFDLDDQFLDPHLAIVECFEEGAHLLGGVDRVDGEFDSGDVLIALGSIEIGREVGEGEFLVSSVPGNVEAKPSIER
jgi:hypothetical protein